MSAIPSTHPPAPGPARGISAAHRALFLALPKAELHCHLLGTVRRRTFLELAAAVGAPVPREEIERFYVRGDKPVGVLHILRALDQHVITRPGDLYRLAYEYLEDARAQGVRYSEFFWNPTGTARASGIPYAAALDAILAAIRDAERDHGIIGRLIPSIDREAGPEAAVEMVEWVLARRRPEVVGIGIDYRENEQPPERFWKAYRLARQAGLRTTAHAGEFGLPWLNVETALELLQCDRIDHGYTLVDRPGLARACAERGTVFTVVPTNSYYLRTLAPERWAQDHPIRAMAALGLRIHPNSDDPAFHQVTPSQVWELMVSHFGFGLADLRAFMLNGLDGAWIDAGTRRAWAAEWAAAFDTLAAACT